MYRIHVTIDVPTLELANNLKADISKLASTLYCESVINEVRKPVEFNVKSSDICRSTVGPVNEADDI